jgi:hypothetical protein
MNTRKLKIPAFVAGVCGMSVAAAEFDGSEALMCSFIDDCGQRQRG